MENLNLIQLAQRHLYINSFTLIIKWISPAGGTEPEVEIGSLCFKLSYQYLKISNYKTKFKLYFIFPLFPWNQNSINSFVIWYHFKYFCISYNFTSILKRNWNKLPKLQIHLQLHPFCGQGGPVGIAFYWQIQWARLSQCTRDLIGFFSEQCRW